MEKQLRTLISQLVKEELSPVTAPRERVVKEYAPLIKYIAQKIAAVNRDDIAYTSPSTAENQKESEKV